MSDLDPLSPSTSTQPSTQLVEVPKTVNPAILDTHNPSVALENTQNDYFWFALEVAKSTPILNKDNLEIGRAGLSYKILELVVKEIYIDTRLPSANPYDLKETKYNGRLFAFRNLSDTARKGYSSGKNVPTIGLVEKGKKDTVGVLFPISKINDDDKEHRKLTSITVDLLVEISKDIRAMQDDEWVQDTQETWISEQSFTYHRQPNQDIVGLNSSKNPNTPAIYYAPQMIGFNPDNQAVPHSSPYMFGNPAPEMFCEQQHLPQPNQPQSENIWFLLLGDYETDLNTYTWLGKKRKKQASKSNLASSILDLEHKDFVKFCNRADKLNEVRVCHQNFSLVRMDDDRENLEKMLSEKGFVKAENGLNGLEMPMVLDIEKGKEYPADETQKYQKYLWKTKFSDNNRIYLSNLKTPDDLTYPKNWNVQYLVKNPTVQFLWATVNSMRIYENAPQEFINSLQFSYNAFIQDEKIKNCDPKTVFSASQVTEDLLQICETLDFPVNMSLGTILEHIRMLAFEILPDLQQEPSRLTVEFLPTLTDFLNKGLECSKNQATEYLIKMNSVIPHSEQLSLIFDGLVLALGLVSGYSSEQWLDKLREIGYQYEALKDENLAPANDNSANFNVNVFCVYDIKQ